MPEKIKIRDLAEIIKEKLGQVTNLKTVWVGRMFIDDPDYYEQEGPNKKHILAYGEPEIIQDGANIMISYLQDGLVRYEVKSDPIKGANCNVLYLILEIDTSNNYSIENLDDDDIIEGSPFTLIK